MITGNPASGNGGSFSGLASSALPSLGGDPLTRPTWKRSLQELAASNIALMSGSTNANTNANANGTMKTNGYGNAANNGGSSSHGAAPPTAAAQILLGPRTDFGSLLTKRRSSNTNNTSRNVNTKNHQLRSDSSSSSSRFSFDAMSGNGGIEAVVRRHRDGMLERILKDQREQTQRLLDTAVERQVEDDWKEERNWWRKELVGDRNLVDATNKDNHYNPAGTSSSSSSRNETAGMKQRSIGAFGLSNPAQGLLVADYSGGAANKKNTMYATGCDPKAMQDHLAIVQQIQPASDQDPLQIVAGFEQLACTETFGGGYKNAWMILGSMLPRMQHNSGPIGASQGAQSHFCKQYQTIIHNHVKSASLSGQDISTPVNYGVGNNSSSSSSSSMAAMIASYVKLISGSNASVWEILYYCTCYICVVLCCVVLCCAVSHHTIPLFVSFRCGLLMTIILTHVWLFSFFFVTLFIFAMQFSPDRPSLRGCQCRECGIECHACWTGRIFGATHTEPSD